MFRPSLFWTAEERGQRGEGPSARFRFSERMTSNTMSLLEITGLTHAFGGQPLFQNAAFALHRGEHVGVVGRNGAGKSTLLKLCTGQLVPDGGRIVWQGGIRVGCLDQYAALNPEHTMGEVLHGAFRPLYALERAMTELYDRAAAGDGAALAAAARRQEELEARGFYEVDTRVEKAAAGLGLAELGLDRPFLERYVSWLGDFVRGDMGSSYNYSMPVSQMLQGKIPVTGLLTLLSFLLIVVLSIPLGLFTARHSGGALDKALTVVNQVLMAVPAFFTGILLTYLFGLLLRWFVPGSFVSPAESFWQSAGYLVFPAAAIAIPRIAMTVKMLRSALLAEMNKDYVRTSYSRGNDRRATLYLHVLRNALPPVVSFLAMTVADIVAGSVVIEQVFAIPGLGRLLLTSISNRDYPVVQAIVVLVAFWVVLVNLLGDLLNQRLDPRLRLTD